MTSMLEQERAEALDLVVDAILAERPPIDAGVDREHGLVEPELGDAGKPRHGEIGADLDDGVDVRSVHIDDGVAQLALRHMRDQHGARALEPLQAYALEPVPEGLRRHAHDQIVGLARHHVVDRLQHLLADIVHQLIEVVIVADRIVGDMDAAKMIGNAARPHGFELRLYGGVGRRRYDAEFLAEAERVGHGRELAAGRIRKTMALPTFVVAYKEERRASALPRGGRQAVLALNVSRSPPPSDMLEF